MAIVKFIFLTKEKWVVKNNRGISVNGDVHVSCDL